MLPLKWMQLALLCVVLPLTAGNRIVSSVTKRWSTESFPNPMKDPSACGRPGISHSAVCDPEKVMSATAQDIVEYAINNVTSAEIAAVLIPHMDTSKYHSDIDETAKGMAMNLHNTWGVGDAVKQNGILILVSSKDRAVFISVGSGVRSQLSDGALDAIINRMKPHLKKFSWEGGFVSAILDINHVLSTGTALPTKEGDSPLQGVLGFAAMVGIIVAISYFKSRSDRRRMNELTRGRAALDSLIKDVKNAEHRVYMSSSCPMCLEDFAAEPELGDARPGSNGTTGTLVPKTLPCGHVFCEPCIRQYLSTSATANCPVCREVLHHAVEDAPGEYEAIPSGHRHAHYPHRYRNHMQTMLFRSRRIRTLYPSALDSSTHSVLETAVSSGILSDAIVVVERRSIEVQSMITEMHNAAKARRSSSGSSRTSFGGGRSSGGRGGRF